MAVLCCGDYYFLVGAVILVRVYGNVNGTKHGAITEENQENVPNHTTRATMNWFRSKYIQMLK